MGVRPCLRSSRAMSFSLSPERLPVRTLPSLATARKKKVAGIRGPRGGRVLPICGMRLDAETRRRGERRGEMQERECGEDRDSCVRRVAESAESAEGRSPSFARIGRLKAAPPSARPSFARIGKLKHAPPTARPSFARMHKAEPYATGN